MNFDFFASSAVFSSCIPDYLHIYVMSRPIFSAIASVLGLAVSSLVIACLSRGFVLRSASSVHHGTCL